MAVLEGIPGLPAADGGFVPAVVPGQPGSASRIAGIKEEIALSIAAGSNR